MIADASLFVDDIPWGKAEFSFESFLTANGVEEAIPLTRLFEFVVVVGDGDGDDDGKEVVVTKDFLVGSWLCERLVRDGGDVGDKFVDVGSFTVVVVVVVVGLCSNRDIRPREPSKTVFDVDCWALSCNFWSSDRCESSIDVCW